MRKSSRRYLPSYKPAEWAPTPGRKKGNPLRRRLEYDVIMAQVRADPERLKRRLIGLLNDQTPVLPGIGNCLLFMGSRRKDGYGRMNFAYVKQIGGLSRKKIRMHVQIDAQRVFLIMMLRRPIAMGHDAGHVEGCPHRHCVRHIFEQTMVSNYNTNGKEHTGSDVPF